METAQQTNIWQGKRVFLTGHTGFKGGWLALWLASKGAIVRGYALDPYTTPNLFDEARIGTLVEDVRGDIRDGAKLEEALSSFAPEVVFHMAAQPLVRYSYQDPIGTFETNVIGTARVLDAVRRTPTVRAVVSITTDKCYENKEWLWGYRETDPLGGYDPYSSSKACAEIVSAAYRQSYFPVEKLSEHHCGVATARAGNVIGGGDWSTDRLLPDLLRGFERGETVRIRRPHSIRPWQHVLEPLHGYLLLLQGMLRGDAAAASAWNFGPAEDDAWTVEQIAAHTADLWGSGARFVVDTETDAPHEAGLLRLDASKARAALGWRPALRTPEALAMVVRWHRAHAAGDDIQGFTRDQIASYEGLLTRFGL
jgi:CDP-glucose 4,6-dehydratase